MSPQTETTTAPKMKLAVLTVFVLLVAVNGAPKMDHEYQDSSGNQLDNYENVHTETANNLGGLDDTYTESGKHGEDEGTENNHHEYEEDGGSAHTGYAEDETSDQANEDERAEEESSNNKDEDGSESSEESSEEDQNKEHKHWFSRHHKQEHYSSDGEKGDSTAKKVTDKVHKMVRAQVLKKASTFSGSEVKADEGGALARKVGSMMRDATIRKMAPQLFSKPLHGAVNLLKSHYTMDNEKRGTLATRDVDTFYERAIARDLGFRVADRVINTVSTVVGGALAAGTIHKLHKTSHDDVNQVVDELGAEKLAELAEELNEEPDQTVHTANQVRSLHSKKEEHKKKKEHKQKEEHEKKGHFWSKSKHEKGEVEKKDKHHKKDAHEKKDKHHIWSLKKKHNKEVSDEDDDDDDNEQENQLPLTHHID